MNAAAYLDADASELADREHTNRDTNTNRPLTDPVLQELEYAADLFRSGSDAVSRELAVLRGVDVPLDWLAIDRAARTLLCAAVVIRIRTLREHERRAA